MRRVVHVYDAAGDAGNGGRKLGDVLDPVAHKELLPGDVNQVSQSVSQSGFYL